MGTPTLWQARRFPDYELDTPDPRHPDRRRRPTTAGLTLLSAAIAGTVVFPLAWLVIEAVTVERSRAMELLFSSGTVEVLLNSLLLMAGVTVFSILLEFRWRISPPAPTFPSVGSGPLSPRSRLSCRATSARSRSSPRSGPEVSSTTYSRHWGSTEFRKYTGSRARFS